MRQIAEGLQLLGKFPPYVRQSLSHGGGYLSIAGTWWDGPTRFYEQLQGHRVTDVARTRHAHPDHQGACPRGLHDAEATAMVRPR